MYGWASIAVLRQVRGRRYSAHCGRLSMSVKKKAQADQAEGGNCESDNPVMKPSIEQPSVTAKSRRPQLFYADDFPPPTSIELQVIGHIQSPYKERFGTPRQATVTEQTLGGKPQRAQIQLVDDARFTLALRGLAGFSRIWIISWMHLNTGWTPLVRPPRGPRKKQGLFATRSPHRPNQIALSCVEVEHVDESSRTIHVVGIDLIDRTPVLDIKPYIVYADSFPAARGGWLDKLDEPMNAPDFLSYSPPPQRLLSNSEPRGVSENQQQDKNKTN